MLSLKDNPPVKSPTIESLGGVQGDWFVAHTKSRNEKAFAWDLLRQNVPHFLPMVQRVTFSGGRKRRSLAALFPGYVFFAGDGETRSQAMATGRLCQVIPVPDQTRLVGELTQIDAVLATGHDLEYFPHASVGQHVRVTAGPYEGTEGTVIEHAPPNEAGEVVIVLGVSILGVGAAIRVPPSLITTADAPVEVAPKTTVKYERVDPPAREQRGRPLPPGK